MIKQFTDLDQSKSLLDSGLDIRTADMYYDEEEDVHVPVRGYIGYKKFFDEHPVYFPCWSMARLMALLPDEIKVGSKRVFKLYHFSIEKLEPWMYDVAYYRTNYATGEQDVLIEETCMDSPLDALANVLLWTLKNGYQDEDVYKDIIENE